MASEFSLEKLPMASCRPLRATPRCSYAMFPTAGQPVRYATCMAENASKACKTYLWVAPILRILEARG